jgi:hypothetical protein
VGLLHTFFNVVLDSVTCNCLCFSPNSMGKELNVEFFGACAPFLSGLESSSTATESLACSTTHISRISATSCCGTHASCCRRDVSSSHGFSTQLSNLLSVVNVEGISLSCSGGPVRSTLAVDLLNLATLFVGHCLACCQRCNQLTHRS